MRTTFIGNLSEAKVWTAFVEAGYLISKPFGDGHPYDLVVDDGEKLLHVQCKTARLTRGIVFFWTKSNNGRWYSPGGSRGYAGKADLIAAYCPETGKVYVIPAEGTQASGISLRIEPTANRQAKNIRWARDYELQPLK